MDSIAKVALPQTSNSLTTQQRTLLIRKAKKIEQLLGCPPLLVDDAYDHKTSLLSQPYATPTFRPSQYPRSSIDSVSSASTSSCDSLEDDVRSSSCCPFKTWSSRSEHNTTTRPDLTPIPSNRTWSTKPTLSVLISDQSDIWDDSTEGESLRSTFAPIHSLPPSPITIPSFSIPSANSLRKAKVDRLRKKLGSGFPVELVFPCDDSPRSSRDPIYSKPSSRILSFTKKKPTTISHTQASTSPSTPSKRLQRSRSRGPSNRVTCCPSSSPVLLVSMGISDPKTAKQTLSLIPESPDEYIVESKAPTITSRHVKESPSLLPGIVDSPPSCCGNDSGNLYSVLSMLKKRSPSYRKPPPPIPDDLISL